MIMMILFEQVSTYSLIVYRCKTLRQSVPTLSASLKVSSILSRDTSFMISMMENRQRAAVSRGDWLRRGLVSFGATHGMGHGGCISVPHEIYPRIN